jgi:hypothetical protein
MPRRSLLWPDPRVKPPFGAAEIDWAHPLALSLYAAFMLSEDGGSILSGLRDVRGVITAAGWSATAKGIGLTFNGTSAFVDVPNFSVSGGRFSLAARVLDSSPLVGTNGALFDSGGTDRLVISTNQGNWGSTAHALTLFDGGGVDLGAAQSCPHAVWNDIVVSASGATNASAGYVNGVVTGTGTCAASTLSAATAIGSRFSENSLFYLGQLAHMFLYSRALGAADALWLHAEPYAMLRPIVRQRYFVPAPAASLTRSFGIISG